MLASISVPVVEPFDTQTHPLNTGIRWKKWIERFENYVLAAGITEDSRKKALLLHLAGEQVFEIHKSLPEHEEAQIGNQSEYLKTKKKLDDFFGSRINVEFEIFKFRQAMQESGESVDQFYARLRQLSKHCNFDKPDDEIKNQIILNTNNRKLRKYALCEKPSLMKILERGKLLEQTEKQINEMENASNALTVNKVQKHETNRNNRERFNDKE